MRMCGRYCDYESALAHTKRVCEHNVANYSMHKLLHVALSCESHKRKHVSCVDSQTYSQRPQWLLLQYLRDTCCAFGTGCVFAPAYMVFAGVQLAARFVRHVRIQCGFNRLRKDFLHGYSADAVHGSVLADALSDAPHET